MSLSTLLEAAKYLDYLDSNPQQGQQQRHHQQPNHDQKILDSNQSHQQQSISHQQYLPTTPLTTSQQSTTKQRSTRRQRASKKDAANTMVAMSLPASTGSFQMQQGVPIPLASGSGAHHHHHHSGHHNYHASLSSSFTTESPLSSFASTALLCSKASGVASTPSSAASSLSSSDSSSSCGEILMGDADFTNNHPTSVSTGGSSSNSQGNNAHRSSNKRKNSTHQQFNINNNSIEPISTTNHHQLQSSANIINNLHHQQQPVMMHKFSPGSYNDTKSGGQSFARYIAATSTGPQLVTMTTTASGGITSASAPIDGRIRAGHVIHAATQQATGGFDPQQFLSGGRDSQQTNFSLASSLGSDNHLGSPPMIMTRVQPMILNSISPSAHQSLLAFQPTHAASAIAGVASSPTSSSSSYSRHRELHKTLEKNRRAHLRHCFELLKSELPASECADKKTSHINIIKSAIRYVLALRQQECEIDNELQRLTKIKNDLTEKLSTMRIGDQQQQRLQQVLNRQALKIEQISSHQEMSVTEQTQDTGVSASPASSGAAAENMSDTFDTVDDMKLDQSPQPPEQQLSFLLSQSKID